MSIGEAVNAARQAGFSGTSLITIVAIAGAESGYNSQAIGDGGTSYGLTQVHLPAHPQYTAAQMLDPVQNMAAAYEISGGGQNWQPWTTFKTGAYQQYLPESQQTVETGGGAGVVQTANHDVATVIQFALDQIGKPYVYGGNGPDSWDCSGLTKGAYATIGIDMPHDSTLQAVMGNAVDKSQIQTGDLVFKFGDGVENGHVGIALDPTSMVVAPHTGTNVQVQSIDMNATTAVRRLVSTGTGGMSNIWIPTPGGMIPGPGDLPGGGSIPNPLDWAKSLGSIASSVGSLSTQMGKIALWFVGPHGRHNILRLIQILMGIWGIILGIGIMAKVPQQLPAAAIKAAVA